MLNVNKAFTVGYAELIRKKIAKISLRLFGDMILNTHLGKIRRFGLLLHVATFKELFFNGAKLIRKFRIHQFKPKEHATDFLAERYNQCYLGY